MSFMLFYYILNHTTHKCDSACFRHEQQWKMYTFFYRPVFSIRHFIYFIYIVCVTMHVFEDNKNVFFNTISWMRHAFEWARQNRKDFHLIYSNRRRKIYIFFMIIWNCNWVSRYIIGRIDLAKSIHKYILCCWFFFLIQTKH